MEETSGAANAEVLYGDEGDDVSVVVGLGGEAEEPEGLRPEKASQMDMMGRG